ncbi:MAG TPA: hypothetical protein VLB84_03130, partial [Bacteroidia bacterium]|nr:hypothetical protein [Bacteroidia bacterium]
MFLISCQEEKIDDMIISNSLPIQFYVNGVPYDRDTTPGVHQACYCQMINNDDPIKIQLSHTTGVNLYVDVYHDGRIIYTRPIPEISTGIYQTTFTPVAAIKNKKVFFLITDGSSETQLLSNPSFASNLSSWTATGWTQTAGNAVFEFSSSLPEAEISQLISEKQPGYYRAKFNYSFNLFGSTSHSFTYKLIFISGSTEVQVFEYDTTLTQGFSVSFDETVYVNHAFNEVKLYLEFNNDNSLPSAEGSPVIIPTASLDEWIDLCAEMVEPTPEYLSEWTTGLN